jgi:hypothetical protein
VVCRAYQDITISEPQLWTDDQTVSAQNFKNFGGWLGHEFTVEVPVV